MLESGESIWSNIKERTLSGYEKAISVYLKYIINKKISLEIDYRKGALLSDG